MRLSRLDVGGCRDYHPKNDGSRASRRAGNTIRAGFGRSSRIAASLSWMIVPGPRRVCVPLWVEDGCARPPSLPVRQVLLCFEAGKEGQNLRQTLMVRRYIRFSRRDGGDDARRSAAYGNAITRRASYSPFERLCYGPSWAATCSSRPNR